MVAIAYILSKQSIWKKIVSITITFLLIIEMIISTIYKTEEATGIATFSAFGGWQLASNAMFPLKHVNFDSADFDTKTSKEMCVFIKHFYDSLKTKNHFNPDTIVNTQYMWCWYSPLIQYQNYYFTKIYLPSYNLHPSGKSIDRFIVLHPKLLSWNSAGPVFVIKKKQPQYDLLSFTAMGPVFEEFGTEVIKKYPLEYLRYYIWPNITVYFHPPVELLEKYNEYFTTLGYPETTFYNFPSNKIDRSYAGLIYILMAPWSWLFTLINILFLLLVTAYYFVRAYKNDGWFNRCLIFYLTFYLSYALFNIVGSPTLFRYYLAIVTLSIAFIIYLWQRVFNAKKNIGF